MLTMAENAYTERGLTMFTINFDTDGAGFRSVDTSTHTASRTEHLDAACEGVATILDGIAEKIRTGWRGGRVLDGNGIGVGTWELDLSAIDEEVELDPAAEDEAMRDYLGDREHDARKDAKLTGEDE